MLLWLKTHLAKEKQSGERERENLRPAQQWGDGNLQREVSLFCKWVFRADACEFPGLAPGWLTSKSSSWPSPPSSTSPRSLLNTSSLCPARCHPLCICFFRTWHCSRKRGDDLLRLTDEDSEAQRRKVTWLTSHS